MLTSNSTYEEWMAAADKFADHFERKLAKKTPAEAEMIMSRWERWLGLEPIDSSVAGDEGGENV